MEFSEKKLFFHLAAKLFNKFVTSRFCSVAFHAFLGTRALGHCEVNVVSICCDYVWSTGVQLFGLYFLS